MKTPIADFVKAYRERSPIRLHMPGHKGAGLWDREALDITEVKGADSLYEAEGIIAKSEEMPPASLARRGPFIPPRAPLSPSAPCSPSSRCTKERGAERP